MFREHGQGTMDELRNRDFRKELEERERDREKDKSSTRRMIEPPRETSATSAKRQKIDQVPTASLDADDPLDEDDSDSESDEDDTAALLAELQRIKKERAAEQAKKVGSLSDAHKFLYVLILLFSVRNFRFVGNGEAARGGKNKNGEYSLRESFIKLLVPERTNRHESQATVGRRRRFQELRSLRAEEEARCVYKRFIEK